MALNVWSAIVNVLSHVSCSVLWEPMGDGKRVISLAENHVLLWDLQESSSKATVRLIIFIIAVFHSPSLSTAAMTLALHITMFSSLTFIYISHLYEFLFSKKCSCVFFCFLFFHKMKAYHDQGLSSSENDKKAKISHCMCILRCLECKKWITVALKPCQSLSFLSMSVKKVNTAMKNFM